MLQAAAFQFSGAVGTGAKDQRGVGRKAVCGGFAGMDGTSFRYGNVLLKFDAGSFGCASHNLIDGILYALNQNITAFQLVISNGFINGNGLCVSDSRPHRQGAACRCQVIGIENLGLAGYHKAHIANAAHLAYVQVFGPAILHSLDEVLVPQQVPLGMGMDDGHIAVINVRCVGCLQISSGGKHGIHSELGRFIQLIAAGDRGFVALSIHLGYIHHIGAAHQFLTDHRIHGFTGLIAQKPGGLDNGIVNGSELQQVRLADIVAILHDGGCNGFHRHAVAIGHRGFSQGLQCLFQGGKLSKFNGLAAAPGNGIFVGKLHMYQVGASQLNKPLLIIGFHFRGHAAAAGGMGIQISKVLKIQGNSFGFHQFSSISFVNGNPYSLLGSPVRPLAPGVRSPPWPPWTACHNESLVS